MNVIHFWSLYCGYLIISQYITMTYLFGWFCLSTCHWLPFCYGALEACVRNMVIATTFVVYAWASKRCLSSGHAGLLMCWINVGWWCRPKKWHDKIARTSKAVWISGCLLVCVVFGLNVPEHHVYFEQEFLDELLRPHIATAISLMLITTKAHNE